MGETPGKTESKIAARARTVQEGIPAAKAERSRLTDAIREHLDTHGAVPPLSVDELHAHTDGVLAAAEIDSSCRDYAAVMVNNEVWQDSLAAVPYDRRLLLLPQCLRDAENCPAEIDELGLLCQACGRCCIGDLKTEADRLGYVVLIAEGSPVVMSLIESGQVEAVIGVSCLEVLEKVFPYMESAAVPGIALPLLVDGCVNTSVDLDAIWEALYLTSEDKTRRMDLEALRRDVQGWFTIEAMDELLGASTTETETIARDWLIGAGKRWRPFLAACVFRALRGDPDAPLPGDLQRIAVAIECFHKASLVHDDIEDEDDERYGRMTLHRRYGVSIALNIGDYLLGLGYDLLAGCDAPADRRAAMLRVAAAGHRELCVGQGEELCWTRTPRVLSTDQVLDIFRRKTSPAFEVALHLGAIHAGADRDVLDVLSEYSEALGIAYQIRDDLADFAGEGGDAWAMRPSVLPAIACERADDKQRPVLEALWNRDDEASATEAERLVAELSAEAVAAGMLEAHKGRAVRCLAAIDNANLKGLLRRVVGRIFKDVETMSCCNDHRTGNAPGSRPRPTSSR